MSIERLVVLTITPGAGGIAAYRASESDTTPLPTDNNNAVCDGV
jgi:hypothetical protein